ncbi:hypothetical protein DACRYDRAFT_84104 [Dacryopinax primogenitus]|uniref:Zn(2)-C6 fungal-type domain-containing protein n=1 Tax=Dacryopinax primogenitus (strain DJM 731) TaxID=1858805 RepID=M5FWI6_DACPD|nr:uncharacterized protein DACRYDRAFT_84104 [Dacryopinax primogenitus]EJT97771.1 hypothetical protein DACRYDRAFT_84104 [Dacryopinax primogenitus]
MPKAAAPATGPTLARNQACHTCRKRKQKCDAQRPFCGGCVRSWKARGQTISDTAGGTPACTYDDPWDFVPGNTMHDAQTIDHLKARIGELEKNLPGRPTHPHSHLHPDPPYVNGGIFHGLNGSKPFSSTATTPYNQPVTGLTALFGTPDLTPSMSANSSANGSPQSFGPMFFNNWPAHLPLPDMLHHLVDVFFAHFPLAARIIHRPSFLHGLTHSPSDPLFPPASLLHAICAYASMFSPAVPTPIIQDTPPPDQGDQPPKKPVKRPESFGDLQARLARSSADESTALGLHLVENFQAITILGWYWFAQARWVELWIWSGVALRQAVPLGLNVSDEIPTTLNRSGKTALLPSLPDTVEGRIDMEMRRNTFWAAYLLERYACASATWANSLDEQDISTELPICQADWEQGIKLEYPRQRLGTVDVLTSHPQEILDAFGMHVKAVHLMSRVHLHNLRFRTSPQAVGVSNPREAPAFKQLDGLIAAFVYSLPAKFRDPFKADSGNVFDANLYMVAVLPHLAVIHLHDPHVVATDPNDPSADRVLSAARAILHTVYILCSTSFDITLLIHACCQAWYLAARVLVRFLKAKIDGQDRDAAITLRGEIQVFQLALSRIGEKVPLGQRFGKMLAELLEAEMSEVEERLRLHCEDKEMWDTGIGPMTGVVTGTTPFNLYPSRETSVSVSGGTGSASLNGAATLVEVESPPEMQSLPPNGLQGAILPQLPPDPLDDLSPMQGFDNLLSLDNLGLGMGLPHTLSLGTEIGIDIDFGTLGTLGNPMNSMTNPLGNMGATMGIV